MPIEAHSLANESPTDKLAMLLVGDNKAGKSRLASTAPGPVLFIDTDLRAQALAGIKDIYALTMSDPQQSHMSPTVYNDALTVIGNIEKSRKLRDIHEKFKDVPENVEISTLVFDSIQTMSDAVRNFILYNGKDITRSIQAGPGHVIRVPYSYDGWTAEYEVLKALILRAIAIPKLNLICILHEVPEEAPQSTEKNPIYTGRIEVYPRRYNKILTYFNEVWRVVRPSGPIPTVILQPDGMFTKAATNFNITTAQVPNIGVILQNARNGVGGRK